MDIIKIETVNGNKLINSRSLTEILGYFNPNEKEYVAIKSIFSKITSEGDLMRELKNRQVKLTPVETLLIIKALGNFSVNEANPILEKVLSN